MSDNRITQPELKHAEKTLDWRAAEMLAVLKRSDDDRVSTTTIREETGLDNAKVRYRREKLADLDLIETKTTSRGSGAGMTYHSLTRKGKTAIHYGLLDSFEMGDPGDINELVARVESVEREFEGIRKELGRLEDRIDGVADNLERRVGGVTNVDEHLEDLREDVDELQQRAERDSRRGIFS